MGERDGRRQRHDEGESRNIKENVNKVGDENECHDDDDVDEESTGVKNDNGYEHEGEDEKMRNPWIRTRLVLCALALVLALLLASAQRSRGQ